ncbi:MAG: hypothetical protein ACTSXW_01675 [Candidatus Baldrarchaeia archaeon]
MVAGRKRKRIALILLVLIFVLEVIWLYAPHYLTFWMLTKSESISIIVGENLGEIGCANVTFISYGSVAKIIVKWFSELPNVSETGIDLYGNEIVVFSVSRRVAFLLSVDNEVLTSFAFYQTPFTTYTIMGKGIDVISSNITDSFMEAKIRYFSIFRLFRKNRLKLQEVFVAFGYHSTAGSKKLFHLYPLNIEVSVDENCSEWERIEELPMQYMPSKNYTESFKDFKVVRIGSDRLAFSFRLNTVVDELLLRHSEANCCVSFFAGLEAYKRNSKIYEYSYQGNFDYFRFYNGSIKKNAVMSYWNEETKVYRETELSDDMWAVGSGFETIYVVDGNEIDKADDLDFAFMIEVEWSEVTPLHS